MAPSIAPWAGDLRRVPPAGRVRDRDAEDHGGGKLKARYVVTRRPRVLRRTSRRAGGVGERLPTSLEVAATHGATSVAFPSISTGAYGFPLAAAAHVALSTVAETLPRCPSVTLVRFVLFSADDLKTYAATWQPWRGDAA